MSSGLTGNQGTGAGLSTAPLAVPSGPPPTGSGTSTAPGVLASSGAELAPLDIPSLDIPIYAPVTEDNYQPTAQELRPPSAATLTVRVIKSFEFRTMKALVLKEVDLGRVTVGALKGMCREAIKTTAGFKPFRTGTYDTLKIYTAAHGHKTMNLIINLDHDEWILADEGKTLANIGAENETEFSFFNREQYEAFKANPETKWM